MKYFIIIYILLSALLQAFIPSETKEFMMERVGRSEDPVGRSDILM